MAITIKRLGDGVGGGDEAVIGGLAQLLIETVASGGSVGFMHPLQPDDACSYWEKALDHARKGERIVLGAYEGEMLVATLTLIVECPPNQPHRGELAKMMTSVSYRGRGIARSLIAEAERIAVGLGKTLLVLDTAEEEGASRLYESVGFQRTGVIPDYALKPYGGLTGTIIYWKRISA